VFERVILNRLNTEAEDKGLLEEEQAGFRAGRSTRDQTYILREILDSRKAAGLTTFLCFVDLTNAFPSTWQYGMWFRLQELGVKGSLYRSIRSMYNSCSSAIQTPYELTDWYTSDLGTRQGAVLSPFLFSLLISPLAKALREQGLGIQMGPDCLIGCLLYADDLVLIADSEAEMKRMMLNASAFLRKWRFSVSAKKTQVVACGKGEIRGLKDRSWEIGGETVKDVRNYKYLGVNFEKNGLWTKMRETNIENTDNAYSPLYKIGFAEAGLHIGQSAFLWNLFAKPRLLYGAEVWSVSSQQGWKDLESAQLQGARRIFGKKSNHSTIGEALRGDLGWQSIELQVSLAKLKFYGHLCRLPDNRLLKRVFIHRKNQYDRACQALHIDKFKDDSWYSEFCEICCSLGMPAADWDANVVANLPKGQWNTQVEKLVTLADSSRLFAGF
jgi:hypothetical protein